jgi:1A family penicillin-binding protein
MVDYGRRLSRRSRLKRVNSSKVLLYSKLSRYALFGFIGLVIFTIALFLWYGKDLPTPGKLSDAQLANSTRIYDRNNKLLYSVYQEQNRTYVKLSDIPKDLRNATIAIEDKDFYENKGFSVFGYLRAVKDLLLLRGLTGGSTITQQLVKTVLLSSERTLPRKIKELMLSIQVSQRYSKDEILEMYLNDVPYGGANIGVEAASQSYFGKDVKDLNLSESAFLAGLPQSPSVYSPYTGNKYYIGRTEAVLKQMVEEDYITDEQSKKALSEIKNKKFTRRDESIKAPHFVIYIKQLLAKQFGENAVEQGGLQVTTTLDYDIEKEVEKILKEELEKLKGYRVGNGSAVVMDPKTGEILAMVGSKDYFDEDNDGNFNTALASRQPGSSLKPVVYAASMEKGYTAGTLLMDVKTEFPTGEVARPTYTPVNYDGRFRGPMHVRFALGNSINIPAVKMLANVGIKDVMQKGYDMGIRNWQPTSENMKDVGLSLVLGGRETSLLDEVTAYSVFANQGVKNEPVSILKVTDSKGDKIFEHKKKNGERVLSDGVAFIISHILLDNNARSSAFGARSYLNVPGKTVSVKTGTTDQKRDNWTIGYTPSYTVGVWVGNNDNSPMNPAIASGVTGASPIWNRIMSLVLKDKSDEQPKKPDSVIALQIDSLAGGLPYDNRPTRSEYFIKGTEPTGPSSVYKSKDGKTYVLFRESDPVSSDGKNRWQEGIDAWIKQTYGDDPTYSPSADLFEQKKNEEKKEEKKNEAPPPTSTSTPSPSQTPTPVVTLP